MLTVGSLFTGIGGLDLGLERAGMRVLWQVEIDDYCNKVLEKHWPGVRRYGDIKAIDWSEVEPVDLICGGFPCQPVSVAGARKGDEDERWLWPEFLRAVREVRPRYAFVENVPGLLSTDDGRLARGVFGDLATIGYDAEWNIVSAADVGAPHLRKRVFIVAHAQSDLRSAPRNERPFALDWSNSSLENPRCLVGQEGAEIEDVLFGFIEEGHSRSQSPRSNNARSLADTDGEGLEGGHPETRLTASSGWWAVEPDVGRVANGVPSRVDRLKCLGNAVVPQVAEYIGRLIVEADGT